MPSPSRVVWLIFSLGVLTTPITSQEAEPPASKVTLLKQRRILLPKISPDSKWLAYLTYAPDDDLPIAHIREFGGDGSPRLLAENVLDESDLSWNRTGDEIALLRQFDNRVTLEILQIDGGSEVSAVLPEVDIEGGLGWLKDDRYVVVGCERSVLIINAESGEIFRHVPIAAEAASPDMSRISISDENTIAFSAVTDDETNQKIWIASLESPDASPVSVTEGPADTTPLWLDDSTIVFSRTDEPVKIKGFDVNHLWRVSVPSRRAARISVGSVYDTSPSWSPAEHLLVFSRLPLSSSELPDSAIKEIGGKPHTFSVILNEIADDARDVYFNIRVGYMRLDE